MAKLDWDEQSMTWRTGVCIDFAMGLRKAGTRDVELHTHGVKAHPIRHSAELGLVRLARRSQIVYIIFCFYALTGWTVSVAARTLPGPLAHVDRRRRESLAIRVRY
jgi:hypothetical protein